MGAHVNVAGGVDVWTERDIEHGLSRRVPAAPQRRSETLLLSSGKITR